ncbi:glycosyltransferase family 4 protein, partial [Yinghuangia seranimata]|uniref:glycosyltransferase family 4 protein n=1 Tax=Yinghuangia seranimata TaxID=408067 RepID=UPI00248AD109
MHTPTTSPPVGSIRCVGGAPRAPGAREPRGGPPPPAPPPPPPTPLAALRAFRPDVVHVHNLFPNFTRHWVRDWTGPLVATLHNFRPLCAGANLYRSGATCTACPDGDRWAGLRNGCYRGSRAATAPLAWANRRGAAADPLLGRADRLVTIAELSRRMYTRVGVAAERTVLIPNFVDEAGPDPARPTGRPGEPGGLEPVPTADRRTAAEPPSAPRDRWLFAGRLSAEKGVVELLRVWPHDQGLDVVGDGELADAARAVAPSSVRFLGPLPRAELRGILPAYRGLVFPSRCFEGAPLIEVEAYAAGLPVLAFDGSSVAETVRALGTGRVVTWEEPLGAALRAAAAAFPDLRGHCRAVFAEHFTPRAWLARTEKVYADVVGGCRGGAPPAGGGVRGPPG